jgi:DNA-binding XRE family transcriptional regulator
LQAAVGKIASQMATTALLDQLDGRERWQGSMTVTLTPCRCSARTVDRCLIRVSAQPGRTTSLMLDSLLRRLSHAGGRGCRFFPAPSQAVHKQRTGVNSGKTLGRPRSRDCMMGIEGEGGKVQTRRVACARRNRVRGHMMRPDAQTFGRRLAAIRRSRGLTQVELAVAIGKAGQTVSFWESGCPARDLRAPLDAPISPCPPSWPRIRRRIKRPRRRFGFLVAGEKARHPGGGIKVRSCERRHPPEKPTKDQPASAEVERLKALLVEVLQRLVRYDPDAAELLDLILQPAHPRPTFLV